MKRRKLIRCLRAILMGCVIAFSAELAFGESISIGDYTYSYSLSTKEGTITKYNGSAENVTIPSTFSAPETYRDSDGETHTRHHTIIVTAIGDSAFQNNTTIKSVIFHDKVKTIGWQAFYGCWNLSSDIELPYVTTIGSRAFQGAGIKSIKTSSALKSLGGLAFWFCGNLQEAEINGTGLNLNGSSGLFWDCPNLKKVTFGSGVTSLYLQNGSGWGTCSGTFDGCTNLQSVVVGSGVSSVPASFLYGAGNERDKLSVSFASPVTSVGSSAFCNSNITNIDLRLSNCEVGGYAFAYCGAEMSTLDFTQVTSLGNSAFCGCWNLQRDINLSNATYIDTRAFQGAGITSVKTSALLKSLGSMAFWNCGGLQEAEINGTNLDLVGASMLFNGCSSLKRIVFGDGVISLPVERGSSYDGPFVGCTVLEEVFVGSGVTKIPSSFLNANSSASQPNPGRVSFSGKLTSVGFRSLARPSITNLVIGLADGCAVEDSAFSGCAGVNEKNIDFSRIATIGSSAFSSCVGITGSVNLEMATAIGAGAFQGCTRLASVRTSESLRSLGSYAFRDCAGMIEADIEGTSLNLSGTSSPFMGCTNLRRVVFGDGVTELPKGGYSSTYDGPFIDCTSLEEILVGSNVTKIPSAFLSANRTTSQPRPGKVSFAGVISDVGWRSLAVSSITNLEIQLTVGCTVGDSAFSGCVGVNEKNIDFSRIATIGSSAFSSCVGITGSVNLEMATAIGAGAFQGCAKLASVRTSELLRSLGSYAFRDCAGMIEAEIKGTSLNLSGSSSPFMGCTKLRRVAFGDGVTELPKGGYSSTYDGPFIDCTSLEEILVGSNVTKIPSAFLSANRTTSQPRPGKVSFAGVISDVGWRSLAVSSITNLEICLSIGCAVGSYAFSSCPGVNCQNIDFTKIASIGESAFYACGGIHGNLDISNISGSIGSGAFQSCAGITSVKIGSQTSSIGSSAFRSCSNLSSFTFLGAPPRVGNYTFNNVKSGAVGIYTAEHAAEWEAVIDSKGYWNGLKMKPSYYTVIYDANNGTGARTTATVEWGEPTPAGDGTFTWEAHYFMGWAFAPDSGSSLGSDDVIPEPQEGNTVTLYGQWATFEPVAADWGTGSITLKATGVSLKEGEDFFLSYCDASAAESAGAQWDYVEDYVSTSDGTGVSFTDTQFSTRLGGIPALRYRLQIGKSKEDVRATMCCTTRTRFGLSIGLGSYDSKVYKLYAPKDLSICRNNAELANDVMVQKGGRILPANMVLLTDHTANKATVENISHEWKVLAQEKTKPGDVIFSFIATHGAASGAVLAYDDLYTIGKFQRDIEPFRTGSQIGVKVVILLLNCHSEAMTSAEHDINFEYGSLCTPNIIYVAVADAKESEWSLHRDDDSSSYGRTYSAGGEFFINQGMNKHRADNLKTLHGVEGVFGNRDGRVDLLECTEYMKALAIGKSDQNPTHVQYDSLKSDIMKDTIMVSSDTFSDVSIPQAPRITDVSEKFFSTTIKVQWEEVSNAQYYKVFYAKAGESTEHWIACNGGLTELEIKTADIATADDREDYTPLDNDTFYEFSMVAVNAGGHSLRSNVYTKKTSIASQGTVYKVSLYANGGSVSPTFKNVENGHIVGSLPTPTRNGRTFLGWFTDAVDGVEIGEHSIVSKDIKCYAHWSKPSTVINLPTEWLRCYPSFAMQASDNPLEASELISANGCRTVGECYALGIDPEDPNDDLKITDFKMEDGKPIITLNHTKDGSGNSFESRIKTLGKVNLTDADWIDITDKEQSVYRFFKVTVDLP